MKLLKYEGYTLTFEPEILALKVFKKLHQRDKTKDKSKFIQELAFIYFYADPRSDYQMYTDTEDRINKITEGMGLQKKWKIDKELQEAIDYYKSFSPISAGLLDDTRYIINEFRAKMRSIDFEDLDIKDLKNIQDFIKQIPTLVKDLDEAERTINKEIIQNDKIRGAVEKSMYEDI